MELRQVHLSDHFWRRYQELVRTKMLPYQWQVLNDAIEITIEKERNDNSIPSEKSHAIENFKIAAGRAEGDHYGWVFQDSDVYKWLEAVAYSLINTPDPDLQSLADEVVDLIAQAQEPDGYLGTYFTIREPERKFKRLGESHELYCAGHYIEAAVAYYEACGSRKALDVATRLADCIDAHFGAAEGKIHGADGHEEIEIGLMRLYSVTGEERYLRLAEFFLLERGKDPEFFVRQNREDGGAPLIQGMAGFPKSYFQVHQPVLEQQTAEGHAVRLLYLCIALADLAAQTGREDVKETIRRFWRNIVDHRMYITGGVGSTVIGESFTLDNDLPNDTMYCETCASVALVMFAHQMLRNEWRGEYGDVMERALYNTVPAGMALDGQHFFYVNPLEVVPEKSAKDPTKSHVKPVRPQWLGCACCPPNLARLLTSMQRYIYEERDGSVLVNLFVHSEARLQTDGGEVRITQETGYPREGDVKITVAPAAGCAVELAVRIPGWCGEYRVEVDGVVQEVHVASASEQATNGAMQAAAAGSGESVFERGAAPVPGSVCVRDGILYLGRIERRTEVALSLEMVPKRWYAAPRVSEDVGRVAIGYGPYIYCAESADNGKDLHLVALPEKAALQYEWRDDLLEGVGVISAQAERLFPDLGGSLYSTKKMRAKTRTKLKLIPYYAWANRGAGEMRVWLRES